MEKLTHSVMPKLREAAEEMKKHNDEKMLFPGWSKTLWKERDEPITRAAKAILADGLSYDEGIECSLIDLGCLIRYIADMMED